MVTDCFRLSAEVRFMKYMRTALSVLCVLLCLAAAAFAAPPDEEGELSVIEELAMLRGLVFERAFYSVIIPAQEASVAMSKLAVRGTKDLELAKWAAEAARTHSEEVIAARKAAEKLGGIEQRLYGIERREMNALMGQIATDSTYAEHIARCFKWTIEAARLAVGRTDDAALLYMAEKIIRDRTRLLDDMQNWK